LQEKLSANIAEISAEAAAYFKKLPDDLASVQASMDAELEGAKEEITKIKEGLANTKVEELVTDVNEDNTEVKKKIALQVKPAFQKWALEVNKGIASFRKALNKARKQSKRSAGSSSAKAKECVTANRQKPIVALMLDAMEKAVPGAARPGCDDPVQAVKTGKVAGVMPMPPKLQEDLAKVAGVIAHQRWLTRELNKSPELTSAMSEFKPSVFKSVTACVRKHWSEAFLHPAFPASGAALHAHVFSPQQWAHKDEHFSIGLAPFAMAEVRLLTEGSYGIAGVPLPSVAGDTLTKKIESVMSSAGAAEFMKNALAGAGKGFFMHHDEAESILVVPANHLIVIAGSHADNQEDAEPPSGLRWSLLDSTDAKNVKQTIENLRQCLETHRELQGTEYEALKEMLERTV
jgi:hypothetical protein